jgi:hypothetical protein
MQYPVLGLWNDRARQVRAFLAVGHELVLGQPHQHAGIDLARIVEHQ